MSLIDHFNKRSIVVMVNVYVLPSNNKNNDHIHRYSKTALLLTLQIRKCNVVTHLLLKKIATVTTLFLSILYKKYLCLSQHTR